MNVSCDPTLAQHLASPRQKTRVITEGWFVTNAYCLACSSDALESVRAGRVAADAMCPNCGLLYELKSKASPHRQIVQDGSYVAMQAAMKAGHAPAVMLMQYTKEWQVEKLTALHPVFFTPEIVRRRAKAHIRPRSGQEYWMCDFDISRIPSDGQIVLIDKGVANSAVAARRAYSEAGRFAQVPLAKRGWAAALLDVIRKIDKTDFSLRDVYAYESWLKQGQLYI